MNKVQILTGGVKIPELTTLNKEINEFAKEQFEKNGKNLVKVDISTAITIEDDKQIANPVAIVTYEE